MRRMATDVVEFFNVGTTVSCKTCLGKEVEGEVLAFDSATRMLILKSDATSSRSRVGQKIFRNGNVERTANLGLSVMLFCGKSVV